MRKYVQLAKAIVLQQLLISKLQVGREIFNCPQTFTITAIRKLLWAEPRYSTHNTDDKAQGNCDGIILWFEEATHTCKLCQRSISTSTFTVCFLEWFGWICSLDPQLTNFIITSSTIYWYDSLMNHLSVMPFACETTCTLTHTITR